MKVSYPTRPLIGPNARERGSYVKPLDTDIRKTFAAVAAGELTPAPWTEVADEPHVQAMCVEPPRAAINRTFDQATRILYVIAFLLLAWVLIDYLMGLAK